MEIGYQPFLEDVFQALHLSNKCKPHVKTEVKEFLSLDRLNFVQTDDLQLYDRFGVDGVQNLCHIVDYQRSAFLTFDQFKPKEKLNNCMHYYSLISNIPIEVELHTHNEDLQN